MRYNKPILVDLNMLAATGTPLTCWPGTVVNGNVCLTGATDNNASCNGGTNGFYFPGQDCAAGVTPAGAYSCIPGTTADTECAAGVTPKIYHSGCTSGPTP